MTTPNRWGIRDAGIASFYDLVDGHAIVTLATLKTTGVETTGETVYARGGEGNARLIGFSSNRESRITLQDAIFDNEALAMLTGNSLTAGVKTIDWRDVKATTSSKFTLSKTPSGALTSVYKLNADGTNGTEYTLGDPSLNATEYSINGKELTFHSTVANGTEFRVYYKANTDTTAKSMKVTSDKFGSTFRVTLDCNVVDEFTKKIYKGQLRIPNAKFEDNFNLSLAAEGDPAVLDLNMEILKAGSSTDMWELVIYDDALVV
jgi:hypothetical protein